MSRLESWGSLTHRDWIATIPSWPETFQYRSMVDTALALSKELREEQGVEVVIALTHCRVPNVSGPCPGVVGSVRGGLGIDRQDIKLAKQLGAVDRDTSDSHGVDLLIGGHDHIYYVRITRWDIGRLPSPPLLPVLPLFGLWICLPKSLS